jgi:hypothetical protein
MVYLSQVGHFDILSGLYLVQAGAYIAAAGAVRASAHGRRLFVCYSVSGIICLLLAATYTYDRSKTSEGLPPIMRGISNLGMTQA